jgi:predicted nucleotidyltransferase
LTAALKLRDRDAVTTKENIIFRVYGYTHPPNAYICDVEYAPQAIYQTATPRAYRKAPNQKQIYYKFYFEGLRFVQKNYPRYMVFYAPFQKSLVGIKQKDIKEVRKPKERFKQLITSPPKDTLVKRLQELYTALETRMNLSINDFGVFGSLLHDFYHPEFSDLDLTVYGRKKLEKLRQLLQTLYEEQDSLLKNEFENETAIKDKQWRFQNYSPKEYVWHQKRKLIYALFKSKPSKRTIKTEFEPVKNWKEIRNDYRQQKRIVREGWIKATARITDDKDAAFMPSIYKIELLQVQSKVKADNIMRILSYVEEFRTQTERDETVYVEGNLERVTTPRECFHQITLTYGPKYYEQVLKVTKPES